ncbi:ATP-binding cassette sub-family B member 6-like [Macrosteles quadrilineatus]|uniref:ATP-binding cassette sub-family B member 6-like n=1 Tax=Macrosteles quadrilineatus TaxID=74068 RepID=UPI0023E0E24A|nr:ATP-binding cassette sub-family B member 6-like [Macrosteles quadrilineatus]XP_054265692.1 ATP-binding cassette sub-family B member 6-like [Macrosteles quadrilineatus]
MLYCPPNITITTLWVDNGISECFMATQTAVLTGIFIIFFGSIQLWMYRKYGTPVSMDLLPSSPLYYFQIFITFVLCALALLRFILQVILFKPGVIYGYMIVWTSVSMISFIFSAVLVWVERHFQLPTVPARGHGLVLLLFWTFLFSMENLTFVNLGRHDWWFHPSSFSDKAEMGLFVSRYVLSLLLFGLGLRAPGVVTTQDYVNLNNAFHTSQQSRQDDNTGSTWRTAWRRMKTLMPFLWPKRSARLQLQVLVCILLLVAGRVINLFVPIYNKLIVDSMTTTPLYFRWDLIVTYVGFKFLQGGGTGGMGFLNNMRSFLWVRIQQYTTREVEVTLFQHLHGLSLRWHLSRKTGEVLRVMDRGTDSITNLLNYILFSIIPTLVDIAVAVIYFVSLFNAWFGLIVFVTMALYIAATIIITEWRTKFQRSMNLADNATKARSVDSLLNFETVKYYGAEDYEVQAYRSAVLEYQKEEFKSVVSLNLLNSIQNVIVCGGLLIGSLLCVDLVVNEGTLTVGDYVLFASYIIQLYVPLNWFGTYYRAIQKNFVDMENMFDLLNEEPEVIDAPGAPPIAITGGRVEFRNVVFSYVPERCVLRNINFVVPPGKTVALVGPSGSGKSTIIRLLFRFYDVEQGSIFIDGQNVKTVRQDSLRRAIGVVPQDTVLFNNTIKYNIQYGRVNALDADVVAAAKSADIHSRILSFPEAYNTQVGERGLKLSGGEKQRVAIARTILKAPTVVLLDEATSALDTQTERNIQAALQQVCKNRTTIIVAHRLSTVIHADEILVLREGEIVERGRHEDLVAAGGVYANMWQQQLENNEANDGDQDPSQTPADDETAR